MIEIITKNDFGNVERQEIHRRIKLIGESKGADCGLVESWRKKED